MSAGAGRLAAVIVAVGLGLRIVNLDAPLWFDEIQLLVELVRQPFGTVVSSYTSDNNHPLYSVLSWGAVRLFGESAWALRLPAVLFGAASLGMLFVLGARIASRREALLATVLLAVSYHHVWFSQNARGYTGLLLFTLASTEAFLVARESGKVRHLIVHGVLLGLGTYVHLAGAYVGFAQFAAALLPGRSGPLSLRRRSVLVGGCVLGGVVSLALHAPMLGAMHDFFSGWQGGGRVEAVWRSPWWMMDAARGAFGLSWATFGAAVAVVGAFGVASLVSFGKRDPAVPVLLVLPGLLGFVVSIVLRRNLWPRFFFFQAGFAVLLAVRGLDLLGRVALRRWGSRRAELAVAAGVALVAIASARTLPRAWFTPKQDFPAARAFVLGARAPGEPVLTVGLAIQPFEWLYDQTFVPVRTAGELQGILADGRRAWVVTTLPIFLEAKDPELDREIKARFDEVQRFPGTLGGGDVVVLRSRSP